MQRVTITIDDELDAEVARFMKKRAGYANRSEAIRDLRPRSGLQQAGQTEVGGTRPCVAALGLSL